MLTLEDNIYIRYFNLDSSYVNLQRYNGVYTNKYTHTHNGVLRDIKTKPRGAIFFSKLVSF